MTRNKHGFSTDYDARKAQPIVTGVLDYFPLAILAVAEVSNDGNAQHNPGEPLHWAREKSQDEVNTEARHLLERGTKDGNVLHSAKKAWRALADLQKEIEASLCEDPECEVHVHNADRGGACPLLPRAATWYGRTRDHTTAPKIVTSQTHGPCVDGCDGCRKERYGEAGEHTPERSPDECAECKHPMVHHRNPGCVVLVGPEGSRDYCPCTVKGHGHYPST